MLLTRSLIERIDCRASRGVEEAGFEGEGGQFWGLPKTPSNVYGNQSLQLTLALCALQARAIIHYARPNVKQKRPGIFRARVYGAWVVLGAPVSMETRLVFLSSVSIGMCGAQGWPRSRPRATFAGRCRPLLCGTLLTELQTRGSVACGISLASLATWAAVCHV